MKRIKTWWGKLIIDTRKDEEIKEIETGYKVVAKGDALYLVFNGWVVIAKLEPERTTAEIRAMINGAIDNQKVFQGLND